MPFKDFDVEIQDTNDNNRVLIDNVDIDEGRLKTLVDFDDVISDSFNRLRASTPSIIFDSSFMFNEKDLLFTEKLVGSGSITRDSNNSSMDVAVGTTSGDRAALQTKQYMHYIPGQSMLVFMTGRFDTGTTNCQQKMGYFDDNNGLFFELEGNTLKVVRRTDTSGSVQEFKVEQSNWNIDTFDGNGKSGETLDITKQQVFVIDFQWLGSGRVRFGFSIEGQIYYAHEFNNGNTLDTVYMRLGNLPVRYEVVNTGTTSSSTSLRATCASVISEGGFSGVIATSTANNGVTPKTINDSTFTPVLSIRLKSSFNRAQIILNLLDILSTTKDNVLYQIYYNNTLTGASWNSVGSHSIAEYDVSATALSGGHIIHSGYLSGQTSVSVPQEDTSIRLSSDFDGNPEIITIALKSLGNPSDALAALTFKELY